MNDQKTANLRPGLRLRSQACTTEIIVIRPGQGTVYLTCGGEPMTDIASPSAGPAPRRCRARCRLRARQALHGRV